MDNIINKIKTTDSKEIYLDLINKNLTEEEIIKKLSNNTCLSNHFLYFHAAFNEDTETAYKIINAIEKIEYNRFLEFKKSVIDGTNNKFLSQIDWLSKYFLYFEINGMLEEGHPDLMKYIKDIMNSIKIDEENAKYKEIIAEYYQQKRLADEILYPEIVSNNRKK